ncbi:MAG: GntR family transcriptional regulator [Henriciella sp.]|nr:GntR family transcriptional regulator [Henriciella sp.]
MDENSQSDEQTLQDRVVTTILERIRSGELKTGDRLTPERQLGDEFGVSRTTITKALQKLEFDGWISREQGRGTFVQDPSVVKGNTPKGPTIALLAAVPAHPSLFRCFTGLSRATNEANGQLRLLGSFEGLGSESQMLDRALRDGADGIVVYPGPGYSAPRIYSKLVSEGVPIVLIDRFFPNLATDKVTYADEELGHSICGTLFDQGCSRVAILPHREFEVTTVRDRIDGAVRAAAERGLPADSVAIWHDVYADFSPSRKRLNNRSKQLRRLTDRLQNDPVDGLFAINGDVAERLSRDLDSLVSRDPNIELPRICAVVHQPVDGPQGNRIVMAYENPEEIGKKAAEILFQRIARAGPAQPISVQVQLEVDDGTGEDDH